MGDTGAELGGLLIVIFLFFGLIGAVGFKLIDRLEAKREITKPAAPNSRQVRKIIVILAVLLLMLPIAVGLALLLRKPPPSYNLGENISFGDWAIQVKSYKLPGALLVPEGVGLTPGPGGKLAPVKAQGTWLEVEVVLQNVSMVPLKFDRSNFEVQDSQNDAFSPSGNPVINSYELLKSRPSSTENLLPGASVDRWLVFDIYLDVSGLDLIYKQGSTPRFHLSNGQAR